MKKTAGRIILFLALFAFVAAPLFASAQNASGIPYWPQNGLISCTGNYSYNGTNGNFTGSNPSGQPPCSSLCDLVQTIVNIVYFLITICLFILAPIMVAVGGIMMMISGANPEMLSKGKSVLTAAVVGIVIVLCSYLLVATFVSFLNISGVGGFGSGGSGSITCVAQ